MSVGATTPGQRDIPTKKEKKRIIKKKSSKKGFNGGKRIYSD